MSRSAENDVLCADCYERGDEVRMRGDADFGGHLCPVCEPLDVKMIGRPEERIARYERVYPDPARVTPPGRSERGAIDPAYLLFAILLAPIAAWCWLPSAWWIVAEFVLIGVVLALGCARAAARPSAEPWLVIDRPTLADVTREDLIRALAERAEERAS